MLPWPLSGDHPHDRPVVRAFRCLRVIYRILLNACWRLLWLCCNNVLSCFIHNCCHFHRYGPYPFPFHCLSLSSLLNRSQRLASVILSCHLSNLYDCQFTSTQTPPDLWIPSHAYAFSLKLMTWKVSFLYKKQLRVRANTFLISIVCSLKMTIVPVRWYCRSTYCFMWLWILACPSQGRAGSGCV